MKISVTASPRLSNCVHITQIVFPINCVFKPTIAVENGLGILTNHKTCFSFFLSFFLSFLRVSFTVSCLLPSPRPDGARALGGAAGGGRGQTLPAAAHPAQELPGEALLQLAAGAVVSLQSPGTHPSSHPRGLHAFPAAGVNGKTHHEMAELMEAAAGGSEVSLWPLKVLVRSVGKQGKFRSGKPLHLIFQPSAEIYSNTGSSTASL